MGPRLPSVLWLLPVTELPDPTSIIAISTSFSTSSSRVREVEAAVASSLSGSEVNCPTWGRTGAVVSMASGEVEVVDPDSVVLLLVLVLVLIVLVSVDNHL